MATKHKLEVLKMVDVYSMDLFEDEGVNWQYCKANATFSHKEACEFILHIGTEKDYYKNKIREMKEFGCTRAFIDTYRAAKKKGAVRICFYA